MSVRHIWECDEAAVLALDGHFIDRKFKIARQQLHAYNRNKLEFTFTLLSNNDQGSGVEFFMGAPNFKVTVQGIVLACGLALAGWCPQFLILSK